MRSILEFFSLSDRYERKARLLPGLLLAAPPALTAGTVMQQYGEWYAALGAAAGVEVLVAVALGHFARARGRRAEDALWRVWGGPPTTRWLRPWDETCSEQQKTKWRGSVKRLTGIVLPVSVPDGKSQENVDRVVTDAMRQLRYSLRDRPEARLLAIHNEDYGFARNLYAIRWHWVGIALACVLGSVVGFVAADWPLGAIVVGVVCALIAIAVAYEMPQYVRRCADRYAESLFAAAVMASDADMRAAKTCAEEPSSSR